MTTEIEFINLATRILTQFDGKPENLQRFIDELNTIDMLIGNHQNLAILIIKTKLIGHSRQFITNEISVADIVNTLRQKVKFESSESLSFKLETVKRNEKTITKYAKEIRELTNALANAYVMEGVPVQLAEKYSTSAAVKSIISNSNNEETRIIMTVGQFKNIDEVVQKLLSAANLFDQKQIIFHHSEYNNSYLNKDHRKLCFNCGTLGHISANCNHDEIKCFNCKCFGHIAIDCNEKRNN